MGRVRTTRPWLSLVAPSLLGAALALAHATPGRAQVVIGTVAFPDTAARSTATLGCPAIVGLCFGTGNCEGSGTVQSLVGPAPPFSAAKLNLLTSSQFFGGVCEANPVSLPVQVGAGQILSYEATFSPTALGTVDGALTFGTSVGPATVNLTGRGIAGPPPRIDKGVLSLEVNTEHAVPGGPVTVLYRTKPGTLQGNADVYFAFALPDGALLFLTAEGTLAADPRPVRPNVPVADETLRLFSIAAVPDAPFGVYTLYMALVYPGTDVRDPANWASGLALAAVNYAPLSPEQEGRLGARGNPDFLSVLWVDELLQKRESWLYLSDPPTQMVFVNGVLESEGPADPGGGPGPRLPPGLFSAQTTEAQLTAAFGAPTSVTPFEGAPQYVQLSYGPALVVVLRNGRLSSVLTGVP
jgi:hypothetical protein